MEDIQTRATTIKTYDGRRVIIPNAELFTNAVTVNTAYDRRRLQYDVGIGYGDDIARTRELMLEAMREVDGVLSSRAKVTMQFLGPVIFASCSPLCSSPTPNP